MKNKKRLIIVLAIAVVVVVISIITIFICMQKSVAIPTETSSIITSTQVSDVSLPEIKKIESSDITSQVSSKQPDIKVDGDITSSKNTSSKIFTSKPTSSNSVSSKPPTSSKPIQLPISSEEAPIEEPTTNPDGPQHGETTTDFGDISYYHIGFQTYIDENDWAVYGKYPNLKMAKDSNGYSSIVNESKYIKEGTKKWWAYGDGGKGEWNYFCAHKSIWLSLDQWYCLDYPLEDFGYVDHCQPDHHKK